jgi:hypothetical protein
MRKWSELLRVTFGTEHESTIGAQRARSGGSIIETDIPARLVRQDWGRYPYSFDATLGIASGVLT